MGVPRRTMVKVPHSHPEVVVMLPNPPYDQRISSARVWSGIWSITKHVLLFCLGMIVGALFLTSNDVQKRCLESMVAVGFSSHRAREICYKNPTVSHSGVLTRFDCMPRNANAQDCRRRGCNWDESVQNVPYCFYPDNYGSYSNENVTNINGRTTATMRKKLKSPYPEDVDLLQFEACAETESRLHIKITDAKKDRFEPFYPVVPQVDCKSSKNNQYQVKISEGKMGFKVLRSSSGKVIFDSEDIGALIYANQFLQLNARFPAGSLLYGIGERQSTMNIETSAFQSFTLWNRDAAPTDKINLYGSHPFILIRDQYDQNNSKWHGLFLLNSNAMDIITQPGPAISFRIIGGIMDFYWFMGDTPSKVTEQYLEVIGHPHMPPYWALGFHLCRFGYGSLDNTILVWNRTRAAGIPFDVQWNDLDYMDNNNDFTISPKFSKLSEFVEMLHSIGMHYIPLIDPGVSAGEKKGAYEPYDYGLELGIFVADEKNKPFVGKVWNGISTVWPDFTNPKTVDYWRVMLEKLHSQVPFDGAWIDMNEPSNFYSGTRKGCPKNSLNYPPYVPNVLGGQLFSKTICPSAKHYRGNHYDLHNMYGISEAIITSFALVEIRNEKRPVTISRATFPGHGHYAAHWTGDVFSTWNDLKLSVAQTLNFNMFGIPFVGADICGFNGNTTVELCARWSQLGAFYPFSRNHNSDDTKEQDPVILGPTVVTAAKNALEIRYSLLPYLYYLFYDSHVNGKTVARPLFYEFPEDENTHLLETEFMWGSCLLIIPVLEEGKTTVEGYFPIGTWYDLNSNKTLIAKSALKKTMNAPLDLIPLFVRGGCILPTQAAKATTTESRKTPLTVRVYLDANGRGQGSAYFDDGDYVYSIDEGKYSLVNFAVKNKVLVGTVAKSGFAQIPTLETVLIHGECASVTKLEVNGKTWNNFTHNKSSCILTTIISANVLEGIKITWQTS
ncbi:lysosomal alpha-glucosidase-like [Thrips palmi]|uniref:Lysosomal alpha-glucosidase-like n=1 Tax=Thrips palmi TaxID=161013 RepID=A0A6P8ZY44_THRPL|nr:lysosomal alpha-glucosidase-like [Thrips palmi]